MRALLLAAALLLPVLAGADSIVVIRRIGTTSTSTSSTSSSTTSTAATPTTTSSSTSSSSSSSSSSTSTSTSSTTSTTEPTSSSFLWVPHTPTADTTYNVPFVSNQMRCMSMVAPLSISPTKIAWAVTGNAANASWGVAVYNADGSSRLATTGAVSVTGAGIISATGLSFSLTGGIKYRVCFCESSGTIGNTYLGQEWSVSTAHTFDVLNGLVVNVGTSANGCTAGAPPTTTGALTAGARPMLVLFSVE